MAERVCVCDEFDIGALCHTRKLKFSIHIHLFIFYKPNIEITSGSSEYVQCRRGLHFWAWAQLWNMLGC